MQKIFPHLIILLLLLFTTCSKKDPIGPVHPTECQLSGFTAANQIEMLSYNSSGLVETISVNYFGTDYDASIGYDSQGHLLDIHDNHQHTHFTTGSNGLPSTATVNLSDVSGQDSLLIWTIRYSYTTSGLIDTMRYDQYTYRRYEFDGDGNVSKIYAKAGAEAESLVWEYSDYDDKNSPLEAFPFVLNFYLGIGDSPTYITVDLDPVRKQHNSRSLKIYNNGTPTTYTSSYTYNDTDYPITATQGSNAVQFQYDCK